jgi:hypothetical protein
MTQANMENTLLWKERITKAHQFHGGLRDYCKAEGITEASLFYWRKKLNLVKPKEASPFTRAVVKSDIPNPSDAASVTTHLPDAQWVASVLCHFVRGLR